ncbi:hypothetical protein [Variovorax sp. Root473]|uniref:hypothetical protein n=1 Tax=Variovorax sp. Root473 TaxID=1736541 RepID=UPI0007020A84|nr:hypothetical protein [Variovorax sp. Root473]KQX87085.1 hypothetical protein ASD34_12260 [Variovorax sp. Root473]
MKSITVQIQPEKSPGIDLARLTELFTALAGRAELVQHHAFDSGTDGGADFNFTFGTRNAGELWRAIVDLIYQAPEHKTHMASASMAMCSGESGWYAYIQLFHRDPSVPVVSAPGI